MLLKTREDKVVFPEVEIFKVRSKAQMKALSIWKYASTPAITSIHESSDNKLTTMLDFVADYGISNEQ